MAPQDFPTGLITFLFSDIENSTLLWERYGEEMRTALARHDEILYTAVQEHNGTIVKTTGDGAYAVFTSANDALKAATSAQRTLHDEVWSAIEPDVIRAHGHP